MRIDPSLLDALSPDALQEVIQLLAAIDERERGNLIDFLYADADLLLKEGIFPYDSKLTEAARHADGILHGRASYPKHVEFMNAGKKFRKRYSMAGNRIGKTLKGAIEVAYHTTGRYPHWWDGHRFTTCNDWWAIADTTETVRDNLQALLIGRVGAFGTGLIPKECIDFSTLKDAQKLSTGVGAVRIKHINGTSSSIAFKAYSQGREKLQSAAVSVWLDEEPPLAIYSECVARAITGNNIIICTFTPLNGYSPLIQQLFPNGDIESEGDLGDGRWLTRVTMDDVKHLTEQKIQEALAEFPTWQRKARRMGLPILEAGAIFPYAEEDITCEPFKIPDHWPRAYGMDTGNRTTAIWVAMDPDTGAKYAYGEHYGKDQLPVIHASAIKSKGDWLIGAMDTAGNAVNPTDLQKLSDIYTGEGLHLVNANKAVTAGIYTLQTLFQQGQLKIFKTLTGLIQEVKSYHMKEDANTGKVAIVKVNDDRIDALRYCIMTDGIFQTKAEAEQRSAPIVIDEVYSTSFAEDAWAM